MVYNEDNGTYHCIRRSEIRQLRNQSVPRFNVYWGLCKDDYKQRLVKHQHRRKNDYIVLLFFVDK